MKNNNLALLREFVSMTIDESNIPEGAGIIVVKKIPGSGWKVLALKCHDGTLDIPKGGIDPGENAFQAAVRETDEESNITQLNFEWGMQPIIFSKLTCYVASTNQVPTIKKNPHTNVFEHSGFLWVSWSDMIAGTKSYLKPCIAWAMGVVEHV